MSDLDSFIASLSDDPVRIKYTTVPARELLSGQVHLPCLYGTGVLNELVVKEGEVLASNVKVIFDPYRETMFFHTKDRMLIECVLDLVRSKYDTLTSGGLCIKPIYSRPSGYTHKKGKKENLLYTYELEDLLRGKIAALPYHLYVNKADGSMLPDAVPILAHRVSVHIYSDVYLQFKPNSISVSEVIDICKIKYKENEPIIHNINWGIEGNTIAQAFKGKHLKTLDHIEFDLCDLLDRKSYLPAEKVAGKYYLTYPIVVKTSTTEQIFRNGTPLTTLWSKWEPLSGNTTCVCEQKYTNLCIFNASPLLGGTETLPSIKGLVTSCNVVVQFDEDSMLCYKKNTLIQEILWQVHRLLKSNKMEQSKYTFIHRVSRERVRPKKIYKSLFGLLEDFDSKVDQDCLILLDPCCMPMPIPSGVSVKQVEKAYTKAADQLKTMRKTELSNYRMWKNGAREKI